MTEYQMTTETASGLELLVSVGEYSSDGCQIDVTVPVRNIRGIANRVGRIVQGGKPLHVLQLTPRLFVGVTDTVAAQINATIEAREREWHETTDQGRRTAERSEYRRLLDEWRALADNIDEAKEHAFGIDTGLGWDKVRELEHQWEGARQAALDYRASHPDLDAALKAETEERVRSGMWA